MEQVTLSILITSWGAALHLTIFQQIMWITGEDHKYMIIFYDFIQRESYLFEFTMLEIQETNI